MEAAMHFPDGDPVPELGPILLLVSIMPHSWLSYSARLVDESSRGWAPHEV
jgi:hypothetical protein